MQSMKADGLHLAMWSGPRNISTAMMRAWENRRDTTVWDEPLYAYFLDRTGSDHPGAAEIIAAGEPDWRRVVSLATTPTQTHQPIFFQKHMTHHLLDSMGWEWLDRVTNCFLIRDPREVIASYLKIRNDVTAYDVGIPQQAGIFEYVKQRTGKTPLVMDARDILLDPRAQLQKLCEALEVAFDERMLSWPSGPRKSDGVWAKYWYSSVQTSTGFVAYQSKSHALPEHLEPLAAECSPYYEALHAVRL